MLDFGNIPRPPNADVQIFSRPISSVGLGFETWRKPRGVSKIFMFCAGGGGGGGGGFSAAASNPRGGGGGGGSSAVSRLLVNAYNIPDILFLEVGAGGLGVSSGTGGVGRVSAISISPVGQQTNYILLSGNADSSGGASGTAGAGGGGGAAGTVATIANMIIAGVGNFLAIAGQLGTGGGAQTGANGTAITIPTTSALCQGGSGGAGTTSADFAGGACTSIGSSWLSQQRPATPAAGSFNGSGGPQIWKPFFSFGGLGGSSSNTGIGGVGGHGARGAGGGGGGGGTTGGRGGDGGSGIVIIVSW